VDRIGAAATGAYLYLEPFFTLAAAWSLLGEPLTLNALAGGVLVLLGVALVDRSGFRPPPRVSPTT
jgi:drug/metabolite transporter (DMT)-like permease